MSEKSERPVIHYSVDGEAQSTNESTLTPTQILTNAGIEPSDHYLVEIEGRHRESYKDKMDATIHMHEGQEFVSVFTGPVTVSSL